MRLKERVLKVVNFRFLLILVLTGTALTGCKAKDDGDDNIIPPPPEDTVVAKVYLTRGDRTKLFNTEPEISIKTTGSTNSLITVDTAVTFQIIEGYGAALTGSSAYLLNRKMSTGARGSLLRDLFDPDNGIGISYLRLTMGASDFSLSNFSYDDMPAGQTDYQLEHFSLSQDTLEVIPMAKAILAINPDITFLGSPWSPPAWMKSSGNMVGGSLKTEAYDVYGDYFIKYIQAMAGKGIPIKAVTPQNEPLYGGAAYPCMDMSANEQLNFIKDYLGPKFQAAGLNTEIIIYDHNWDRPDYPITILNDPQAKQYVAGSAFHAYAGDVSAMSQVHNAHPDKGLYFTEISGGRWATDFSDNLMWNMRNIFIGTAKNWSKNALLWNLALDENDGPKNNGCGDCRGVVTINSGSGVVTRNEEYYSLAHFAKFVRPGAVRVSTTASQEASSLDAVAFMNTDKSKVLVVANYGDQYKIFTIKQDKKYMSYSIPEKSVVTIIWK